jgi:hypothetical protein
MNNTNYLRHEVQMLFEGCHFGHPLLSVGFMLYCRNSNTSPYIPCGMVISLCIYVCILSP